MTNYKSPRLVAAILVAFIAGIIIVATVGSGPVATDLQAQAPTPTPCPNDIQGFEASCIPNVSGVDTFVCFNTVPSSALACTGGSENVASPGAWLTMYRVVNAPRGHRWYSMVSYTPGDWSFNQDGPPTNDPIGSITLRTDLGCDGATPDILAETSSTNAWPTGWTGFDLEHIDQSAAGTFVAKRTPSTFAPISYDRAGTAGMDEVFVEGNPAWDYTLPYANTRPVPVEILVERSPYKGLLNATSVLIGDQVRARQNDFPCIDSPYDLVVKNTQWKSPSTIGWYPIWTVLYSEPDIRTGKVTMIVDHQCVGVGSGLPTDADHDCLVDSTEAGLGLNASLADTDGDGIRDGFEIAAGSNPAAADSDVDGANDFDELTQFTDPNMADTDGDGYKDEQWTWSAGATLDNCPSVFNSTQVNSDAMVWVVPNVLTGHAGRILTASLLTSDNTAAVEDATTFNPTGGWIAIEGELLQYSSANTSTNILDLVASPTVTHNRWAMVSVATKLTAAISSDAGSASTTTVAIQSRDGFPSSGYALIAGEYVHYASTTGAPAIVVDQRGLGGSAATGHSNNSLVILAEPDTSPSSTLQVGSVSLANATGGLALVDGEVVRYTGKDTTNRQLTGVTRGAVGTLSRFHSGNVNVEGPAQAVLPMRSGGIVYFLKDLTNPGGDIYGDACDPNDDNDWLSDTNEQFLRIGTHLATGSCGSTVVPTPLPSATPVILTPISSTSSDSDRDLFLDGAECAFDSRPDIAFAGTPTPAIWDLVAGCGTVDGCAIPPIATGGSDPDNDGLYANGTSTHWLVETSFRTRGIADPRNIYALNYDADGDGTDGASDNDSDNDLIKDGIEVKFYGTSPASADTDGDGCADGREIADLTGDRNVNVADLGTLATAFSIGAVRDATGQAENLSKRYADVNKDGALNAADTGLIASLYGSCPAPVSPPIVKVSQ